MDINQVYYDNLFQSTKRYNILYGGSGSGKSVAIAQWLIKLMLERKDFKVLAMRKYDVGIKDSVFAELKAVISRSNMEKFFHVTESPKTITNKKNGNKILFRGLDDPEKLKSIQGINIIWMEEASEFDYADFDEANRRLRGDCEYPHQLILSFNPTVVTSWLNETFFTPGNPFQEGGDMMILHTTYRDNKWAGAKAAAVYATMTAEARRVYEHGEWGRVNTDGLFYGKFNSLKHADDDIEVDPSQPLLLSFDFNVLPSVTCLVSQMRGNNEIVFIDEITLPSPNNNTQAVCTQVLKRYKDHPGGFVVTGDPAGKHEDTRSEKGFNDFTIIRTALAELRPIMRVPSKAPNQVPRGNFINDVFECGWNGLSIRISRKCKTLMVDLDNQKQDSKGGKDKTKVKVNGLTMEKYGHASDAFDYQVINVWGSEFELHQKGPAKAVYQFGRNQIGSRFAL